MNSTQDPNKKITKPQNVNNSGSSDPEQPIDAEIIAETPTDSSQTATVDPETIYLVYQSPDNDFFGESSETYDYLPLWLKRGLAPFTTPWGLASLSLVIVSNLLICGVQLWNSRNLPTEEASIEPNATKPLSIPKSLNLARKSSNSVALEGLSTLSVPTAQQSTPQPTASSSSPQKSADPNVVNVNQPLSLTNAILPPSLQPQGVPNYAMPSTPLPVPSPPNTSTPPPVPVSNIPHPVPPSVKPSTMQMQQMAIEPPPPPSSNATVSEDEQVRQAIKQQLRMEEATQTNIPLGFNHKTRLELQNGTNEIPQELMPRQVNHLEQLQQRRVIDSVE